MATEVVPAAEKKIEICWKMAKLEKLQVPVLLAVFHAIIAPMYWISHYDQWCFHRVEALMLWLEEWLSISQERAEQGMIALYIFLYLIPSDWKLDILLVKIACSFSMGGLMWGLHRRPAAVRKLWQRSRFYPGVRIVLQVIFVCIAGFELLATPHRWTDLLLSFSQIVYLVFYYATDMTSDGERGRRRKLVLAELKKMCGTEWIPKFVPMPR